MSYKMPDLYTASPDWGYHVCHDIVSQPASPRATSKTAPAKATRG
jgi:hypothetical protein